MWAEMTAHMCMMVCQMACIRAGMMSERGGQMASNERAMRAELTADTTMVRCQMACMTAEMALITVNHYANRCDKTLHR